MAGRGTLLKTLGFLGLRNVKENNSICPEILRSTDAPRSRPDPPELPPYMGIQAINLTVIATSVAYEFGC